MAGIKGTNRNDKLSGTKDSDTIHGRGGHDRIDGGKGDDKIFGGSGNDKIDDGFDDILDFSFGEDKLEFNGVTREEFLNSFNVDDENDVTGDGVRDTVITIDVSMTDQ
jgi:Ca2+-binding RTX toxin-like protein